MGVLTCVLNVIALAGEFGESRGDVRRIFQESLARVPLG